MAFDPKNSARYLRARATHHVHTHDSWGWSRKHGIKRIVSDQTGKGRESLRNRIKQTARMLWKSFDRNDSLTQMLRLPKEASLRERVMTKYYEVRATLRINLRTDPHRPDGMFPTGVYAMWEEDGEYIQVVQPSVGVLVADFLEAEPENPHAIKIAEEIAAIMDNYSRRISAGEVDGRKRVAESKDEA